MVVQTGPSDLNQLCLLLPTADHPHEVHMSQQKKPTTKTKSEARTGEKLMSAREAALWLDVNPRTAQVRAKRALLSGESAVRSIAGAYCAPDWWWERALAKPIKIGRPHKPDASPS